MAHGKTSATSWEERGRDEGDDGVGGGGAAAPSSPAAASSAASSAGISRSRSDSGG